MSLHNILIFSFGFLLILFIEKSFSQEHYCKDGEEYKECASACEPNCSYANMACILRCMPPKCQCKEGYVRNENNECIPKEKCPKPANSTSTPVVPTKSPPIFPQLCCNPFQLCWKCPPGQHCVGRPGAKRCNPIGCNKLCHIGYECSLITGKPTCVPKCNKGEELKECANPCEPKCGEPIKFCNKMCILKPSCQCLPGYARNSNGICIPQNKCPIITTDKPKYCDINCGIVYVCKIIKGEPTCVPPDFLNKTTTEKPY